MSETASTPAPAPERTDRRAPLDIWREVRRVVCTLFDVFGEPQEMATRHTLTLKDHQLCVKWLRGVEALIRRMLFIEAALIPVPPASSRQTAPAGKLPAVRQRHRIVHDPERPEAWRVTFRIFVSSPVHGASGSRRSRETKGARRAFLVEGRRQARPLGHAARDSARQPKAQSDFGQRRRADRFAAGGGEAKAPRFRSAWPLAERMEALLRVFNNPAPYAKRLAARLRKTSALVARLCEPWAEHRDVITRTLFDALIEPLRCAPAVFNTT